MVWLFTFLGFLAIILLMSLGVIFHNKRIQGSCGGLNNVGVDRCAIVKPLVQSLKDVCIKYPNLTRHLSAKIFCPFR